MKIRFFASPDHLFHMALQIEFYNGIQFYTQIEREEDSIALIDFKILFRKKDRRAYLTIFNFSVGVIFILRHEYMENI